MRIAILGTRGIPNNYGGFEQLAEYLSVGLVEKGHEVFVYNSSLHPYTQPVFKGVKLIRCFDAEDKLGTAGQFVYDLNCIIDSRKRNFDVILQLGYTSSSIWHFLLPKKPCIITNMDGMEWLRSKYSKAVQGFLKRAEKWAVRSSDALIADSLAIKKYLDDKYKQPATFIAYGAPVFTAAAEQVIEKYGVEKGKYDLLIARFEPENNIETIIKGYLKSGNTQPLLLVGSTANSYGTYLVKKYQDKLIRFLGAVYERNELDNLRYFSNLYFHGHSVGGTNPSLLEAMACSARICAHKNPFNEAILGNDALYFSDDASLADVISNKNAEQDRSWISANLGKIRQHYNWPYIIDEYERLMIKMVKHGS